MRRTNRETNCPLVVSKYYRVSNFVRHYSSFSLSQFTHNKRFHLIASLCKMCRTYIFINVSKTNLYRVNFLKYKKPEKDLSNLDRSEVFKIIHNMEYQPRSGIQVRPPKVMAEEDVRKVCFSYNKFANILCYCNFVCGLQRATPISNV